MSIGTTAIELRVSKKKKKEEKDGKNIFGYNIHIWCSFTEIFGILFSFHILIKCHKIINYLKVKVRTEFPNVWGEYKTP